MTRATNGATRLVGSSAGSSRTGPARERGYAIITACQSDRFLGTRSMAYRNTSVTVPHRIKSAVSLIPSPSPQTPLTRI